MDIADGVAFGNADKSYDNPDVDGDGSESGCSKSPSQ